MLATASNDFTSNTIRFHNYYYSYFLLLCKGRQEKTQEFTAVNKTVTNPLRGQ